LDDKASIGMNKGLTMTWVHCLADVIALTVLLPLVILNPFMWKTVLIDVTRDYFGSRAWRDFDSFRIFTILLQLVALNLGKLMLLILLCADLIMIVNIPYLIATAYHMHRLEGTEDEFLTEGDKKCMDCCLKQCGFGAELYKHDTFKKINDKKHKFNKEEIEFYDVAPLEDRYIVDLV
jgi:hypothetical protein